MLQNREIAGEMPFTGQHTEFCEDGALSVETQSRRCSDAAKAAKEFLLNAPQKVDVERLTCLMQTYAEHGHEPVILLRAKVLEHLLRTKKIYIDDNPLVGTITAYPAGVYVYPEWDPEWILKEMNQAMMSHLGKVNITPEEKKIMQEAARFFKTRSVGSKARKISQEMHGFDPIPLINAGVFEGNMYTHGTGNLDYETFIQRGLNAIIRETEERLRSLPVNVENSSKISFYRATIITMKAVIHLAERYADLAREMAEQTDDAVRKAELLGIADTCRNVPANPPRSFREAVQSWWFLHLCIQIEQAGCGSSPGRLGQYLDPYYQADKAAGIGRENALAWLQCLFVKIMEYGYYQGIAYSQLLSGHTGHTISVGGLNADGLDATTELDYLILDTQIEMRTIQPTITVLYHDGLEEDFLLKAVELERTGLGQPQWLNTRIIIERLLARHAESGITLKDARNCVNMSCVTTSVAGKSAFIRENGPFNLAKCLELALNDGLDPMTQKQVGAHTGNPEHFASFEDVFAAYSTQVLHMFRQIRPFGSITVKALGDTVPSPFRSAMYGGCLERGRHEYEGGADYYVYYLISTAGVDAANSLAAIKHLVFDTKKVSMGQLMQALKANFEGHEDIRQMCLAAPKHGNGDDAMDKLVRRVYDDSINHFHSVDESYFGKQKANVEAYSLSIHNYFGMLTGALPTGRLKGTALTDGSVSAMPGTDTNGPMALMRSAAKALDTVRYGSNHFNMKFHPSALKGIQGARKLIALIKAYMDMGGSHIQFNVVSSETLRKAQETPEDYKNLTVRVAGFSAYYTRLHKGVQNELIARTELTL